MDLNTRERAQTTLPDLEETLTGLLDVAGNLCASGFRPGLPPSLTAKTVAIDARMVCRRCGHEGMRYQPYSRKHGNGSGFAYRALGQCPRCGSVEEV